MTQIQNPETLSLFCPKCQEGLKLQENTLLTLGHANTKMGPKQAPGPFLVHKPPYLGSHFFVSGSNFLPIPQIFWTPDLA